MHAGAQGCWGAFSRCNLVTEMPKWVFLGVGSANFAAGLLFGLFHHCSPLFPAVIFVMWKEKILETLWHWVVCELILFYFLSEMRWDSRAGKTPERNIISGKIWFLGHWWKGAAAPGRWEIQQKGEQNLGRCWNNTWVEVWEILVLDKVEGSISNWPNWSSKFVI